MSRGNAAAEKNRAGLILSLRLHGANQEGRPTLPCTRGSPRAAARTYRVHAKTTFSKSPNLVDDIHL